MIAALHVSLDKVSIEANWPVVWAVAVAAAVIIAALLWYFLRKRR
jgi:hypothetical protein